MTTPEKRYGKKLYGWFDVYVNGPGTEHRRHNGTTERVRRASKRSARAAIERFERRETPSSMDGEYDDYFCGCEKCSYEFTLEDYARNTERLATLGDVIKLRGASSLLDRRPGPTSEPAVRVS